jgi:hypothetical protein
MLFPGDIPEKIPQRGIVKLSQKIARLCSKERTMEDVGLS